MKATELTVTIMMGLMMTAMISCHREDSAQSTRASRWQCSMHPEIIRSEPGLCPICHMALREIDAPPPGGTAPVAGRAGFTLPESRRQLIGVTFAEAQTRPLESLIRAPARVALDPGLYAALEEHRQAAQALSGLPAEASPETRALAESIARSTRLRLKGQGLSEESLAEASKEGAEASQALVAGGAGKEVWVYADVYEKDVNSVRPGQVVELTGPALAGEAYYAVITGVDPALDPITRTVRARAKVANPLGRLRPQMFLEARIRVPLGRRLALPRSAVVDTGERRVVFVVREDESFEPREVSVGTETEDYIEIRSGLGEGTKVVASANFLIDSESQFRAAAAAFGPKIHSGGSEDRHGRH